MKACFKEITAITVIALGAAGVTWWFAGPSPAEELCRPELLKADEVCIGDVWGSPGLVWVDARSRDLWERNGLPGSVFLTDHAEEDWEALVGEAAEQLFEAELVVIYCATEGCGSSREVATRIQDLGLLEANQVKILAGGWKSLQSRESR